MFENKPIRDNQWIWYSMEYGYKPDGSYVTPYENTIFAGDGIFDAFMVSVANNSQVMFMAPGLDHANACEFITPKLFVLGTMSLPELESFLARGFQQIWVLGGGEYQDSRIQSCTYMELIYDHALIVGLPFMYALELLAGVESPDGAGLNTVFKHPYKDSGRLLLAGIGGGKLNVLSVLTNTCRQPLGTELIDDFVEKGFLQAKIQEEQESSTVNKAQVITWLGHQMFLVDKISPGVLTKLFAASAKDNLSRPPPVYCVQITHQLESKHYLRYQIASLGTSTVRDLPVGDLPVEYLEIGQNTGLVLRVEVELPAVSAEKPGQESLSCSPFATN